MSQAQERVTKFSRDAEKLLEGDVKEAKLIKEVKKLQEWMRKHQDESINTAKSVLFSVVKRYHQAGTASGATEALSDSTSGLLDDYLKLPEGKLVTSKCKEAVLKMLRQYHGFGKGTADAQDCAAACEPVRWMVCDLDDSSGLLQLVRGEEVMEGVAVATPTILEAVQAGMDEGIEVLVQGGRVIAIG